MRDLTELDNYRVKDQRVFERYGGYGDHETGLFRVKGPNKAALTVIASAGYGFDHVSISTQWRIPLWNEMEFVKRMFFKPTETAYQLHMPPDQHINIHPYVLHLWRCHTQDPPIPPSIMV